MACPSRRVLDRSELRLGPLSPARLAPLPPARFDAERPGEAGVDRRPDRTGRDEDEGRSGIPPAYCSAVGLLAAVLARDETPARKIRTPVIRDRQSTESPSGPKRHLARPKSGQMKEIRRRPTLPGRIHPSTIGADRLNFRVRNGNGCGPVAIATETYVTEQHHPRRAGASKNSIANTSDIQALGRLVPVGSMRHRNSTSGLSTWWSPTGLTRLTRWLDSSWNGLPT